jgi:hypothetical protein
MSALATCADADYRKTLTEKGTAAMTTFDDREHAEEAKFAHDAEVLFRIQARRNKLLGNWAAERMGLDPAETESYARSVVQAEFEEAGDDDVIRKVLGDLLLAGVDVSDAEVRKSLESRAVEARRQLMGEV